MVRWARGSYRLNPTPRTPKHLLQTHTLMLSWAYATYRLPAPSRIKQCNILVLDHININHQAGRHDLLKVHAFFTQNAHIGHSHLPLTLELYVCTYARTDICTHT